SRRMSVAGVSIRLITSGCYERLEDRSEDVRAVGPTEQRFHVALRVGHHAEDVPVLVHDPGDIASGSVRIRLGCDLAGRIAVPENDPTLSLESVKHLAGRVVVAL